MILDWLLDEVPQDILQYLEVYTFGCLANHFNNPYRSHETAANEGTLAVQPQKDLSVSYIEHYANAFDFAARWGVLHFTGTQAERDRGFENRFMGRVFVNAVPGHQLNQHYLGALFPLDSTRRFAREPVAGDFMGMDARVEESEGDKGASTKASVRLVAKMALDGRNGLANDETHSDDILRVPKMWECSRLWQYRNGATPTPPS